MTVGMLKKQICFFRIKTRDSREVNFENTEINSIYSDNIIKSFQVIKAALYSLSYKTI